MNEVRKSNAQLHDYRRNRAELQFVRQFQTEVPRGVAKFNRSIGGRFFSQSARPAAGVPAAKASSAPCAPPDRKRHPLRARQAAIAALPRRTRSGVRRGPIPAIPCFATFPGLRFSSRGRASGAASSREGAADLLAVPSRAPGCGRAAAGRRRSGPSLRATSPDVTYKIDSRRVPCENSAVER